MSGLVVAAWKDVVADQHVELVRASPSPTATAKPLKKVVKLSGNGDGGVKKSGKFKTDGSWRIDYKYRCTDGVGNFIVTRNADSELPVPEVNELKESGEGKLKMHVAGTVDLEIYSFCDWTVTAVDVP